MISTCDLSCLHTLVLISMRFGIAFVFGNGKLSSNPKFSELFPSSITFVLNRVQVQIHSRILGLNFFSIYGTVLFHAAKKRGHPRKLTTWMFLKP